MSKDRIVTGYKNGPLQSQLAELAEKTPKDSGGDLIRAAKRMIDWELGTALGFERFTGTETDRALPAHNARIEANRTGPMPEFLGNNEKNQENDLPLRN